MIENIPKILSFSSSIATIKLLLHENERVVREIKGFNYQAFIQLDVLNFESLS
jgi:hypothetical protein